MSARRAAAPRPATNRFRGLVPASVLLLVAAVAAAPGCRQAGDSGRMLVAVTVPPQAWLVRQLGRERVQVEVLLPPGSDEHAYEPTPQQIARLAGARVAVTVGHPSFAFERRFLDALAARESRPLQVAMIRHAPPEDAEPGHPHDHAGHSDPHLWLSPTVMRGTAVELADVLARVDPAGAALYRHNVALVLAEIDGVDAALRRDLAGLGQRRFLVVHPSWGHLAHDYGLEQAAIEVEGKEPSPRLLVALIERARRDGTRTVFTQRGLSDRSARTLATELDARLVTLDPMAEDWPANLRRVGALLREALSV